MGRLKPNGCRLRMAAVQEPKPGGTSVIWPPWPLVYREPGLDSSVETLNPLKSPDGQDSGLRELDSAHTGYD